MFYKEMVEKKVEFSGQIAGNISWDFWKTEVPPEKLLRKLSVRGWKGKLSCGLETALVLFNRN